MSSFNQFEQSWQTYKITRDSLKVLNRVVDSGEESFLHDTAFPGLTPKEFKTWYMRSFSDLDDYIILTLFALFEQILVDYLKQKSHKILEETPKEISKNLYDKISQKMQFWQQIERFKILKGFIDTKLIENLIQVKEYRDWIAHKNPRKKPPAKPISPESVYDSFKSVIEQIQK